MSDPLPFTVDLPGAPPSVNHLYLLSVHPGRSGRHIRKADGVEEYQNAVTLLVRTCLPRSFKEALASDQHRPIRLKYWLHLKTAMDADNALKALNDAIAKALGVNDSRFLPCVQHKSTKHAQPHVVVEISLDQGSCHR